MSVCNGIPAYLLKKPFRNSGITNLQAGVKDGLSNGFGGQLIHG
ncbi:MAG: hypothetical protein ACP5MB_10720 [bacterium]